MNKHEKKYYNTTKAIQESLISLLESNDFDKLTVNDICKKANINRSTFYLHYMNMDDLLKETINSKNNIFIEKYKDVIVLKDYTNLINFEKNFIVSYLEFIKTNKLLYSVAHKLFSDFEIEKIHEYILKEIAFPILKDGGLESKAIDYVSEFYIMGTSAIISKWVKSNCIDDINDIYDYLAICINKKGE